jgi:hypothetical protein
MNEAEELRKLVNEARQWVPKLMRYWHLRADDAISGELRDAIAKTRIETETGDMISLPAEAVEAIARNVQRVL